MQSRKRGLPTLRRRESANGWGTSKLEKLYPPGQRVRHPPSISSLELPAPDRVLVLRLRLFSRF